MTSLSAADVRGALHGSSIEPPTIAIPDWWASLVPGINHGSADKPTGLAAGLISSFRSLFDLQSLIEVNQPDGVPPDVDVKWVAWRISEFLSPPTGLIHSEPLS